jgi:hypothetical protein
MTEVNEHRSPFAPIGEALRDLREAEAQLRAEQEVAWHRYVQRVDEILAADLPTVAGPTGGEAVSHSLFDAVRARLDDLRVQAKLGAMEGEDLLTHVRSAITQAGTHLPG